VSKGKQTGFTLVELMIATGVFSVVISIGMYGFIQINRFYTRNLNIIRTQEAARNLMADIANQFQLTSGMYQGRTLDDGTRVVCTGNKSYVYKINTVEDPTTNSHAITSYNISPGSCPDPQTLTDPVYLLKPGARIIQLDVTPYPNSNTGPLFDITVALLFAPKDKASSLDEPGTDLIDAGTPPGYNNWRCISSVKGSEYCSLSRLSTSVYKRVQGND
jgi:prepilin-type N-terminal cleavage/methylation domain-containing protein